MEQVILAFANEKNAKRISHILESEGVAGCLICGSASEVKRLVSRQAASVVLCGYKLPDETAESLWEDLPGACRMLVIAVQGMLDLINTDGIVKMPAPVSRSELLSQVRSLLQAVRPARPQRTEEELSLIQQAKTVLMERYGMGEDQAHRTLQKRSMDAGIRLTQMARMVLDGTAGD